jgi:hypothetical protein
MGRYALSGLRAIDRWRLFVTIIAQRSGGWSWSRVASHHGWASRQAASAWFKKEVRFWDGVSSVTGTREVGGEGP